MVFNELNAAFEVYEKISKKKRISYQQKMFDRTLISMYYFGSQPGHKAVTGMGRYATTESEFDTVNDLPKIDRFNAIKEGELRGLIKDCSTFDGREWYLTLDGVSYAEALLDGIKN